MKHGYKRAIAMLLAATVMTGLTACGGGSSSGGGSGSASGGSGDGTFTASGKTLNVGVTVQHHFYSYGIRRGEGVFR